MVGVGGRGTNAGLLLFAWGAYVNLSIMWTCG